MININLPSTKLNDLQVGNPTRTVFRLNKMLKAKGKSLTSVREKQLVQWNHNKINSLLLIKNNGSQSAERKIRKRYVHFDCGDERPPPKNILENGLLRY